jgi:hypothetical protein
MMRLNYTQHSCTTIDVPVGSEPLFEYLDDHARLTGHMSSRSWMMLGSRMDITLDGHRGQAVGSIIRMEGRVLGVRLFLEEAVIERNPPSRKVWETTAPPSLLVIGRYRMGFSIEAIPNGSRLFVSIDYDLPPRGISRLLGRILGKWYAEWCTRRMASDARVYFIPKV